MVLNNRLEAVPPVARWYQVKMVCMKPTLMRPEAPLEVLGPRLDNGGEGHGAEANHGLGLEVGNEAQGVDGDVRGGV